MTPWVPIQDAADVVMRSVKTLRTWTRRREIRSIRDAHTGDLLVHWLDVQRISDTRRRRASRRSG